MLETQLNVFKSSTSRSRSPIDRGEGRKEEEKQKDSEEVKETESRRDLLNLLQEVAKVEDEEDKEPDSKIINEESPLPARAPTSFSEIAGGTKRS